MKETLSHITVSIFKLIHFAVSLCLKFEHILFEMTDTQLFIGLPLKWKGFKIPTHNL